MKSFLVCKIFIRHRTGNLKKLGLMSNEDQKVDGEHGSIVLGLCSVIQCIL